MQTNLFTENRNSVIRTETNRSTEQSRCQPVELPEHREIVRYDAQHSRRPTNSFFSLFFERPVRHRYCRQLNRSATNLVRRLSQSRLFLNSTRTDNAAYRQNYVRTNTQDSTENPSASVEVELNSENDDVNADEFVSGSANGTLIRSTSMPSMSSERTANAHGSDARSIASETNMVFERAETPPPPYIEVIAETENTT